MKLLVLAFFLVAELAFAKKTPLERLAMLMTKDKTANKAATKAAMADYGVHIENVMEKFDTNKDKKLSANEIKEIFQDYDQDGNSVEDKKAIRKFIKRLRNLRKKKKSVAQKPCTCDGGTPSQDDCDGQEKCKECWFGYEMNEDDNTCRKLEPCTCDGGQPSQEECDGQEKCKACDSGYEMNEEDNTCRKLEPCTCDGGTPSEDDCDGQEKCKECWFGYEMNAADNTCRKLEACTCTHGTPSQEDCDGQEKCKACDFGYEMNEDDNTCGETEVGKLQQILDLLEAMEALE